MPIAKNNSKKLYTKAQKHANSTVHKMAVEKSKSGTTVFEKQCEASNRQTDEQRLHLTNMFRAAYFLFKSELPHTTSWRNLISLVSALDGSGKMTSRLKTAHANAHHLSSTAITDILESFGAAMHQQTVQDLSHVCNDSEFAILADECTNARISTTEKYSAYAFDILDVKALWNVFFVSLR